MKHPRLAGKGGYDRMLGSAVINWEGTREALRRTLDSQYIAFASPAAEEWADFSSDCQADIVARRACLPSHPAMCPSGGVQLCFD
jgi:hypothetical protein